MRVRRAAREDRIAPKLHAQSASTRIETVWVLSTRCRLRPVPVVSVRLIEKWSLFRNCSLLYGLAVYARAPLNHNPTEPVCTCTTRTRATVCSGQTHATNASRHALYGCGSARRCETSPVGLWPLLFVCLEIAVLVYTCGSLVKLAVPICDAI